MKFVRVHSDVIRLSLWSLDAGLVASSVKDEQTYTMHWTVRHESPKWPPSSPQVSRRWLRTISPYASRVWPMEDGLNGDWRVSGKVQRVPRVCELLRHVPEQPTEHDCVHFVSLHAQPVTRMTHSVRLKNRIEDS